MSIEYCRIHDRPVDTDFETDGCVKCERSADFDADVALAESQFVPVGDWEMKHERLLDEVQP